MQYPMSRVECRTLIIHVYNWQRTPSLRTVRATFTAYGSPELSLNYSDYTPPGGGIPPEGKRLKIPNATLLDSFHHIYRHALLRDIDGKGAIAFLRILLITLRLPYL